MKNITSSLSKKEVIGVINSFDRVQATKEFLSGPKRQQDRILKLEACKERKAREKNRSNINNSHRNIPRKISDQEKLYFESLLNRYAQRLKKQNEGHLDLYGKKSEIYNDAKARVENSIMVIGNKRNFTEDEYRKLLRVKKEAENNPGTRIEAEAWRSYIQGRFQESLLRHNCIEEQPSLATTIYWHYHALGDEIRKDIVNQKQGTPANPPDEDTRQK